MTQMIQVMSNPFSCNFSSEEISAYFNRNTAIALGGIALTAAAVIAFTEISFTAVVLTGIAAAALFYLFGDGGPAWGVNREHMKEIARADAQVPVVPQHVRLQGLLTLFDDINFTDPTRPDHVRPSEILDDWRGLTADDARRNLERWVTEIIPNNESYGGVPHNDAQRRQYYAQITELLRHVVAALDRTPTDLVYAVAENGQRYYIPPEAIDDADVPRREAQIKAINQRNRIILQLAAGMNHCGGRVMAESVMAFQKAVLNLQGSPFEVAIKMALHDMRVGIVQEAVMRYCQVGSAFQSHAVVSYSQHLFGPRGMLGRKQIQYSDPYGTFLHLGPAILFRGIILRRFDSLYDRERIITAVKEMIDGIPSASGSRSPGSEINVDVGDIRAWFREHPPGDWANRPVDQEYTSAGEQYVYQGVFDEERISNSRGGEDIVNYLIKREAVEHLLRTLKVIN